MTRLRSLRLPSCPRLALATLALGCPAPSQQVGIVDDGSTTAPSGAGTTETLGSIDGTTTVGSPEETTTSGGSSGIGAESSSGEPCLDWPELATPSAPTQTASIAGTTPLGSVDLGYAFFAMTRQCNFCAGGAPRTLFFSADASQTSWFEDLGEPVEGVRIDLDAGATAGEQHDILAWHLHEGASDAAFAVVVIDAFPSPEDVDAPYDPAAPATLTGAVFVEDEGWNVTGTFEAFYSPAFDTDGVCD